MLLVAHIILGVDYRFFPFSSPDKIRARETGYKAGKLRSMGWFHPWTRSLRKAHLFLAETLTKGKQKPDATEQIKVKLLSINQARKKLATGKITHAPTIIALQKFFLMQQQTQKFH